MSTDCRHINLPTATCHNLGGTAEFFFSDAAQQHAQPLSLNGAQGHSIS